MRIIILALRRASSSSSLILQQSRRQSIVALLGPETSWLLTRAASPTTHDQSDDSTGLFIVAITAIIAINAVGLLDFGVIPPFGLL